MFRANRLLVVSHGAEKTYEPEMLAAEDAAYQGFVVAALVLEIQALAIAQEFDGGEAFSGNPPVVYGLPYPG